MKRLHLIVVGLVSLSLVACGDDDKKSSEKEEKATPAVAQRELGLTRAALQRARATYAAGDKAAAEEQVAEAYLQHFEKVEGTLDERDHELNEELEEAISGELRKKIRSGTAAEVDALFTEAFRDIDRAAVLLR